MKKLINFRPMLFIAISLCLGVVSAYNFFLENMLAGVLLCFAFATFSVFCLITFLKRGHVLRSAIFLPLMLMFFGVGILGTLLQINNFANANLNNHYYKVEGIIEKKNQTDSGNKFVLSDVYVDGNVKGKLYYKVELYSFGYSNLEIGDRIYFESHLIDKELFYNEAFAFYAIEDGVKYTARLSADQIYYLESIPSIFQRVNLFLKDNLEKGMSGESFSVAYAMICGNSDYMDIETLTTYRQAGVAHIFAVSGLHVGFIAAFLSFIFDKLKFNRLIKAIIIALAVLFYAGVCGFSSSSLRAAIMSAVLLFSAVGGSKYDGISSTSLAGIILLITSPIRLFCVGFQLSFAVVLGLLILTPAIARLLRFLPLKLNEKVATVLAAQFSGIPICLSAFGQFSLIAIIVNFVFIPIVSVVFVLTLVLTVIGGAFGIATITLFIPDKAFYLMNLCITAFDYEVFMIGGFAIGIFALFYYLAFISASGFINLTRIGKVVSSLTFAAIFLFGSIIYNVNLNAQTSLIVCGSKEISCTVINSPEEKVMIISDAVKNYPKTRLYSIANDMGVKELDRVIFAGGYEVDIQLFITSLRTVFELSDIVYCGERDEVTEEILKKSFPKYTITYAVDGDDLGSSENYSIIPAHGGKFFDVVINEKRIAVFGSFDKGSFDYKSIDEEYDIAILLHDALNAEHVISANKYVHYTYTLGKINAETAGNLLLKV